MLARLRLDPFLMALLAVAGLWGRPSIGDLAAIAAICAVLLAAVLLLTRQAARLAGLPRPDATGLLFCRSEKSLASAVPMAKPRLPAGQVGVVILSLMLFHQRQLIVCSTIASRLTRQNEPIEESGHVRSNA